MNRRTFVAASVATLALPAAVDFRTLRIGFAVGFYGITPEGERVSLTPGQVAAITGYRR